MFARINVRYGNLSGAPGNAVPTPSYSGHAWITATAATSTNDLFRCLARFGQLSRRPGIDEHAHDMCRIGPGQPSGMSPRQI